MENNTENTGNSSLKAVERLTPWKPGESGNPAGYKKGVPHLSTILKTLMSCKAPEKATEILKERYPEITEEKITRAHLYMAKLEEAAIKGQEWALKIIFDRTEGKPRESIDHTTGGKEITHNIYNIIDGKQKAEIENLHSTADDI